MPTPTDHLSGSGLERHEIPTHLELEDRLVLGLTLRQAMFLLAGLSVSYTVFTQLQGVPFLATAHGLVLRLALAGIPALLALIGAVVQPAGRPLEEWVFVVTRYIATPHIAVWGSRMAEESDEELNGASQRVPLLASIPAMASTPSTAQQKGTH